ncbi:hypothetical protein [Streptomyces sp. SBT349]|uniref:hypothetical protein n=1 Tax=Streptomyces sp. SBT349 TaxID=1580539 RepID=UPI00099DDD9E|nr:hypothetical protein [Streptomyces sp. SBT349]
MSRRSLLAGVLLAGALTGCTSGGGDAAAEAAASTRGLRRREARESTALLARYEATVSAHPSLAGPLTPFRDVVSAHVGALHEPGEETTGVAGAPPEVPAAKEQAIAALAEAERRAAEERLRALTDAPPELARLLASLAAAGEVQAHLLNEVRA